MATKPRGCKSWKCRAEILEGRATAVPVLSGADTQQPRVNGGRGGRRVVRGRTSSAFRRSTTRRSESVGIVYYRRLVGEERGTIDGLGFLRGNDCSAGAQLEDKKKSLRDRRRRAEERGGRSDARGLESSRRQNIENERRRSVEQRQ
jgi:hypothetical protein